MDETLRRRVGGRALDTCVVLFLIVVRISLLTLCVSYMKSMSSDNSNDNDTHHVSASADRDYATVGDLAKQLPHATPASDFFVHFLEHVEKLFPFLIQVSIFLLPRDLASHTRSQGTSMKNGRQHSAFSQAMGGSPHDSSVRQFVDKLLSFRLMNKLDWTNCCIFHLYKERGAVAQAASRWPVTCTAAYHAACVSDVVRTGDFDPEGPHFSDWRDLRERMGGRSMIAVPMFSCTQVVAVLGMASSVKNAFHFQREEVAMLMASVLSPCVHELLQFSTRRTEMQHIVNEIISPLASQISQYLAADREKASEEPHLSGKEKEWKRLLSVRSPSGIVPEGSIRNGGRRTGSELSRSESDTSEPIVEGNRPDLTFCVPSYAKKSTRFSFDHVCSTDIDSNWGDFIFNLITLLSVYICFSKVAEQGQTYLAINLCLFVASFDIVLLLLRWIWLDPAYAQGGSMVFACQLYRLVVVPLANTWMSWRVLDNLDFQPDFNYVIFLAMLLIVCIIVGSQVHSLLHTPLQILSIVFAVFSTPAVCHRFDPLPSYPVVCLGGMSAAHMLVAYLIPTVMLQTLAEARRGDISAKGPSFMPHLQVKRLSY